MNFGVFEEARVQSGEFVGVVAVAQEGTFCEEGPACAPRIVAEPRRRIGQSVGFRGDGGDVAQETFKAVTNGGDSEAKEGEQYGAGSEEFEGAQQAEDQKARKQRYVGAARKCEGEGDDDESQGWKGPAALGFVVPSIAEQERCEEGQVAPDEVGIEPCGQQTALVRVPAEVFKASEVGYEIELDEAGDGEQYREGDEQFPGEFLFGGSLLVDDEAQGEKGSPADSVEGAGEKVAGGKGCVVE